MQSDYFTIYQNNNHVYATVPTPVYTTLTPMQLVWSFGYPVTLNTDPGYLNPETTVVLS